MNDFTSFSLTETYTDFYIIMEQEKNNNFLFLYPKNEPEKTLELLQKTKIRIISDKEFDIASLKKIKNIMYEFIEDLVSKSNTSNILWYRIAGSTIFGIFFFYIFNRFIRNPIPLIDDVAFSILAGFAFYFLTVKLNLFSFVSQKTMTKYSPIIDSIQVFPSKSLEKLNKIFDKFLKENYINKFNFETGISFFKEELKELQINEITDIKNFICDVSKNFGFKNYSFYSAKYIKTQKLSLISEERFNFYFLLYNVLLKS
ncbi:MAG: hypothetical protein A2086_00505 [Spirochaetes bacterium GWD1_27_9]|nr:MAG: hypothetical protein A2Y34_11530 [Spirochaetes bacterium GWC1_27_15]OHD39818.1 MAG: hypothetical protein A2086_00505 [Spirochaetes bacterium GWD1_27_9]